MSSSHSRDPRGTRARATATLLAGFALACSTACVSSPPASPSVSSSPETPTLNTSLQPIDVRYGIHARDIEFAILLAIAAPERPPVLEPGQEISADLLARIVGRRAGTRRAGNPWAFAGRKPGLVFAEYEHDPIWMRVAVKYDDQMVMLRIVDSRGLGQTDDHIQARALTHLAELDRRIRQTVIKIAQRNRYGTPVPAKLF